MYIETNKAVDTALESPVSSQATGYAVRASLIAALGGFLFGF